MRKKKQRSARWNAAKKMPPLRHSQPGCTFDWRSSEVCRWLMQQPDIMAIVFESAKDHGEILYDPVTQTWKGAEYDT